MLTIERELDPHLEELTTGRVNADVALLHRVAGRGGFCREVVSPTKLARCHSFAGFDLFFPTLPVNSLLPFELA